MVEMAIKIVVLISVWAVKLYCEEIECFFTRYYDTKLPT